MDNVIVRNFRTQQVEVTHTVKNVCNRLLNTVGRFTEWDVVDYINANGGNVGIKEVIAAIVALTFRGEVKAVKRGGYYAR